jgi:beta-glucosidase
MEKMVTYVKERYNNTPMIITENGKYNNETIRNSLSRRLYTAFLIQLQ